jgi:sec-independent protein translocase protein TatC
MSERRMPFLDHVAELRRRILWAMAAVLVCAVASFAFASRIIEFLKYELLPPAFWKLHTFALGEAFFQEIKVAIIAGFFFSGPFIAYQVWAFIAPALYEKEKRVVIPFVLSAVAFFLAGAAFCFFIVLPYAVEFLVTYGVEHSTPVLQLSAFISFVMLFLLAFGLIFELPVVLYFLGKIGVAKAAPLRRFRRYAIVAAFIVAAILTPTPDIVNQLLMAVPMVVLYELGILGVAHTEKQRAAQEAAERAAEEAARAEEAAAPIVSPGDGAT